MNEQSGSEAASAVPVRPSRLPDWQATVLFGILYAACVAVGQAIAYRPDPYLRLWLPSGVLLGVLLWREPRTWPGFAAVAVVVCTAAGIVRGHSWPLALLVGGVNGAQALLGAWLVRTLVSATPDFSSVAQVAGILLASAVNAALWASADWLWVEAAVGQVTAAEWFLWWSRDLIGTAVVVPIVLSFSRIGPAPASPVIAVTKSETVALALCVVVGGTFVFNDAWHPHIPLSHGLVPVLTWAAIRFGVRGVSIASLVFALLGSLFTAHGAGAAIENELSLLGQVNRLNLFLCVASGTGLLLAASVHERALALARHRDEHLRLDAVFSGTRDALVVADVESGTILDANPAAAELFGRPLSELIGRHQTVLHPPADSPQYRRQFQERAAESSPGLRQAEAARADGTRVLVEISSRTVTLADGRRGVVGAFRDLSERRRSEDRYRSILQSSMDGFWMVDSQGRLQDVNDTACEMSGYTREELLTMYVSDIDAGESREDSLRHIRMITEMGRHRFESRHRRKDGQLRDVEVSTLLVPDHSERIMAFVRDITDEKRSAAIMQARVRLLEYAATHSLEELLVATVDEAETLTGSGIGFLHFLEADQQTVTVQAWSTRTRRDACRTDRSARHANVAEAGVWVDCVRQRRAVIHNDYAALPQRKGLPEDHTTLIREVVVPVFRGGLIVAMLGVGNKPDAYTEVDVETVTRLADLAWDIAERRRTQESLRASEERYRLLVETSNEGVWVMDGEHVTTYINQAMADMLGFAQADMVGRPVEEFFFPEDLEFHGERMTVRHSGLSEIYERRFRRRDGTALWTLASAKALSADDGRFLGSFALFSDITERKDAELALERSRTEIKALARQLVEAQEIASRELARELHDRVGQNLTALNLNFTRLQESLPPQRDARLTGPIQDSLRLVSETMGHVRDVMAELRPPVLEDYGVFTAVRWLGGQFARRTGLVVTVKAEDGVRPSTEVETALFRIAQEALTNVARHAAGTAVAVELIGRDGRLRLRVKDDGVGFEAGGAAKPGCWGLLTMMERAEAVEGRLTVVSAHGAGTSVEVDVPA
jgi:PAS domain S-box-containing protein